MILSKGVVLLRKVVRAIDLFNLWLGSLVRWFSVLLVLIGVLGVFKRYALRVSTAWEYELIMMSGAAMYVLSWGYVLLKNAHARVDVLYSRFSPRGRSLLDAIFCLVLFFPLIGFMVLTSYDWMVFSISINERSAVTYVYPPLYPLRMVVFFGFLAFFLQGVSFFLKKVHHVLRGEEL